MAHITPNTDKEIPCTQCGAFGNIVREGPDPRLKCRGCGFLYNQSDSDRAKKAGQIPDGPPQIQEPPVELNASTDHEAHRRIQEHREKKGYSKIPRKPIYVVIKKDRTDADFCTEKDLKTLIWGYEAQGKTYDVFQLTPKKVEAKVDIQ